ncbi:GTPase ObgE [Malacoplasma muris]|uniref:GTPase ObgE n=1 Tax=Malacoplasma muris TaxID=2119 RepID=UPI00398F2A86
MKFVDKCILELKAGDGGNGVISWRKEAHYPEGGPWGGDGGRGGDVIIIGDHNINTLFDFRYIKKISAENGENGGSKLCHGADGNDVFVKVPVGTIIKNTKDNSIIVDILKTNQQYTICKGGRGGHGNAFFKSSYNKAPTLFENGDKGQQLKVELELKYIADVGLVGLPNAGKSTFINQISNAKSKIGNYQFTTLFPVLGVVQYDNNNLIFADIPGLIEGASHGVGLGFEFLKHIERCHFLIHIISMDDIDNNDVISAYETINNELVKYKHELLNKCIYIVANKMDTENGEKNFEKLKRHLKNKKLYKISALNGQNIDDLLKDIFEEYSKYKNEWEIEKENNVNSYKLIKVEKELDGKITIVRVDDKLWKVTSPKIHYWYNRIPQTTDDNVVRFNQKIQLDEIEKKLKEFGAIKGDIFIIEDIEYIVD